MVFVIHQHESATGIYVSPSNLNPPPTPPYPSGLSQRTSFGCPGKLTLVLVLQAGMEGNIASLSEVFTACSLNTKDD